MTGMRGLPASSVRVTMRMNIESGSSGVVMKMATASFIIKMGMMACKMSDSGANCASSMSKKRWLRPRIPFVCARRREKKEIWSEEKVSTVHAHIHIPLQSRPVCLQRLKCFAGWIDFCKPRMF